MNEAAIAIVGMAGRFPGARDVRALWRNLRDGVECLRGLSDDELLAAGVSADEMAQPNYVKAAAILDDVDKFDASFFGFSPRDAAIMDPQHRHFLECSWEALEDAGHVPTSFSGSIGIFAGSGAGGYLIHHLLKNRRLLDSAGFFLIRQTGNDKDVLATRVAYQFDLRGPSVTVQTACSTSLVAVHLACQSLLNGECDMALAGGVTIEIPHGRGYLHREGEILSRDGHCRAFDASCSGTIFSSGVGLVVLRRLEDALRDHDTIHAVILGSAVNNDGRRKAGFLAPSVAGQAEVITEALEVAGVPADTVSYVEAHGTGTLVGDPIEIKALTQAFRQHTTRSNYCAIGSLKTNLGHLDAAAGVAGLIKTVLALRHRQIPASLNYETPNPEIDFPSSPFYVNQQLSEWPSDGHPRRACVTSLGIGGTNAHVVLEEASYHEPVRSSTSRPYQILPLSAKTASALEQAAARLAAYLREHPHVSLADVAWTLQVGRQVFAHRRIVVARDVDEAARLLSEPPRPAHLARQANPQGLERVAFVFSGQGAQHVNMAAGLYESEPIFRDALDDCAERLRSHLAVDLRELMYPRPDNVREATEQLNQTRITQPALVAVEYSLAQWWLAHGIRPQAMLGHSIGEYVAACLAGVMSLDDVLAITAIRGRLMQQCEPGAMLAVGLAEEEIEISDGLSLAVVNAPGQCVVSGPTRLVDQLENRLQSRDVFCRRLRTSHAFHSIMMDPILSEFRASISQITLHPPRIPYLSNLTGTWITDAEATDPEYWTAHLRNTVRFSACVNELLRDPPGAVLEVGPGRSLTSLVREHARESGQAVPVFSSLGPAGEAADELAVVQTTLGQLWLGGQTIDWSPRHDHAAVRRIPLPTYPFERQRFWIEPDSPRETASGSSSSSAAETGSGRDLAPAAERPVVGEPTSWNQWFYVGSWHRAASPAAESMAPANWLVFVDPLGIGKQIATQLRGAQHDVVEIISGDNYQRKDRNEYVIRPGERKDYDALLHDLVKQGRHPRRIVHLWSLMGPTATEPSCEARLDFSFYSLFFLGQSLLALDLADVHLAAISDRVQAVDGETCHDPIAATMLGPIRVLPKELPGMVCRNIDIQATAQAPGQLAVQILRELSAAVTDPVVALRAGERWIEELVAAKLPPSESERRLKPHGVYLITGGLGGLGLVIAETLARDFQARLVLVVRTPFPAASAWPELQDDEATSPLVRQQLRKLLEIRAVGGEVIVAEGDVTHLDDCQRVIQLARTSFGSLDGIIHAAGVLDDGPLLLKTRDRAARVLDPKVQGTLSLSQAVGDSPLDFFALFSSVSTLLAPAGQIDYVAANSFLDAFAASRPESNRVAINWGRWRDVGAAARESSPHPLLGRRLLESDRELVQSLRLALDTQWVLADHRWHSGRAILPGTCYLEMTRAAIDHGSFHGVEFEDVFFLAPLFVDPGQARDARLHLQLGQDETYEFSVRARDAEWTEHATGRVSRLTQPPPKHQDLARIVDRCHSHVLEFDDQQRTKQEQFFRFGPRWRTLQRIHFGTNEAVAVVELPEALAADVIDYALHPALFDLATGAALYLIENYDQSPAVYFPLSYHRIRIYRPFPRKLFSHLRSRPGNVAGRDVVTFDLTLLDSTGEVLAAIDGFSMRLVSNPEQAIDAERPVPAETAVREETLEQRDISPADGARIFTRILSAKTPPGVFVLPAGLEAASTGSAARGSIGAGKRSSTDEVEQQLVEWWQELLGMDEVNLDDDFLDLGGHSLIVARLFAKIKKSYGVDLGLSTLFEARTVRKMGQLIRDARENRRPDLHASPALVAIQPHGIKPPLYVISGLGGNVIKFHSLAFHLGEDYPMYGLLPRGLDGREPFHTRVEDMAAYYVDAITEMQPEGPYCVVGYSFGGAVAFEVARQMVARGGRVGLLGMFDTIEWSYMEEVGKSLSLRGRLAAFKAQLASEESTERPLEVLRKRIAAKFTRAATRAMQSLGRPVLQDSKDIEEVNAFAGANYRPQPFSGQLTLYRATIRGPLDGDDEYLGWGALADGGIEVHHVSATHFTILQEPAVKVLAEKVRGDVDRVADSVPPNGAYSKEESAAL